MKMGKQGVAALALLTVCLIMPAFAFADGSDPTAVETTVTVTYLPPTSWTTPFDGTVQLFSGTEGNLIPLGSPTTFSVPAVQTVTIVLPPSPITPPNPYLPSGLQIFGDTETTTASGGTVSYQIFAYPPDPIIVAWPPSPVIIYTGMTDGSSVFTASGPIIANDSPVGVGTWTLTETPVASPEPSSLLLLGAGLLGSIGIVKLNVMAA